MTDPQIVSGLLGMKCIPNLKSNPGLQVRQQAVEKTAKVRDVVGYKTLCNASQDVNASAGRGRGKRERINEAKMQRKRNHQKARVDDSFTWLNLFYTAALFVPHQQWVVISHVLINDMALSTHCEVITGKRNVQLGSKREMVVCVKEGNRLGRNCVEPKQSGQMWSL